MLPVEPSRGMVAIMAKKKDVNETAFSVVMAATGQKIDRPSDSDGKKKLETGEQTLAEGERKKKPQTNR